jgi:branched-chain amino acid transport system ATP-binding protein
VLVATALSAGYGRIEALRNVSLEVRPGEIVTMIGANGAGKSTLLRTLAGLLSARAGTIAYDGERLERLGAAQRVQRGLVLVPEGRGILHRMTVHENLLMGGYARRDGPLWNDLQTALARFPALAPRLRQPAGTLSGGEQQMLAIARALVMRPRLLMLDEPSLGLAPLVVREIVRVIGDLRQSGITILLVEQNARQALQLADRCYIMAAGRIVREGRAREFLESREVHEAYLGGLAGRRSAAPPDVGGGSGGPSQCHRPQML